MCANVPSIFECINQRADAIKAERWEAYKALNRRQLTDQQQNIPTVTLDVGVFGQFVVIMRPTEIAMLKGDAHRGLIVKRRPTPELRYCIYCKERHAPSAFVHSPRYLHKLSYACKTSLQEAKRRPWQHLSRVA